MVVSAVAVTGEGRSADSIIWAACIGLRVVIIVHAIVARGAAARRPACYAARITWTR